MSSRLLVPHQHMTRPTIPVEGVVEGEDRSTWMPEHDLDTLFDERLTESIGAIQAPHVAISSN
jgi:hypothetical protein